MRSASVALCWILSLFIWVTLANAAVSAVKDQAALNKLFDQLKQAGNPTEAEAVTEQIWQHWFKTENAEARQLMDRAQLARRAGAFQDALVLLDNIVRLAPNYAEGWNQRATVLFMLGRDAESVADIQKTLRLEPRHFRALSGLGFIHIRSQNWKAAIASIERALEVHPFLRAGALIPKLKEQTKGQPL
ncbi:MAG: tetratricopeptide (TPR) repeat protein [Hyphomicrobiaceae bacterium]|jgi:tetratricopeptide (TPR) repeat protein